MISPLLHLATSVKQPSFHPNHPPVVHDFHLILNTLRQSEPPEMELWRRTLWTDLSHLASALLRLSYRQEDLCCLLKMLGQSLPINLLVLWGRRHFSLWTSFISNFEIGKSKRKQHKENWDSVDWLMDWWIDGWWKLLIDWILSTNSYWRWQLLTITLCVPSVVPVGMPPTRYLRTLPAKIMVSCCGIIIMVASEVIEFQNLPINRGNREYHEKAVNKNAEGDES